MKSLLKASAVLALLATVMVPVMAGAQANVPPPPPGPIVTDVSSTYSFIDSMVNILFTILMILAVIFIIWAAFLYLTAAGNTEKLEKAQQQILYAVIAIVIAVLAKSVPWVVYNFILNRGK